MNITQEFDTITAIATPVGTGGIGVIRISGDKSFEITEKIFDKKLVKGQIMHGKICDGNILIDEVVVLPFKSPNSYTGEDVVEIQCHGGINVVQNVLNLVLKSGARMAERGEYTKRAFLNHKMDLSQAEAVCDLIHAKTSDFAVKSAQNLEGVLAKEIKEIRHDIFEVMSRIVAGIDFPEDMAEPEYSYLEENFTKSIEKIDKILKSAKSSNILRQGIKVAIVGRPNVGKSSLFNKLLSLDRAIVTDIAGTTRDVLTETVDMDGIPVTLIDTAGIRDSENVGKVEEIGIEFSKQSADNADLVLFLYDASTGLTQADNQIFDLIKDKNYIKIANKCDLIDFEIADSLCVSAIQESGIENLKSKIKDLILENDSAETEYITNQRQQNCLLEAKSSLEQALTATQIHQLQDLISIDVKSALLYLDEITGEVVTDEILNNIFDHFCIGK
ncbi:tRNA uridine-5-carboxymethylaminomethyl(34) synthesis GTPase MnmE [bacterium]|nr:tRNA uridine-5-carboxymethylaminomethyl(34) synthesis GTPase MnmE [bacterium]